MQTIKNIIKDTSPNQEHQILNLASSEHMEKLQNDVKDTKPSQESPLS